MSSTLSMLTDYCPRIHGLLDYSKWFSTPHRVTVGITTETGVILLVPSSLSPIVPSTGISHHTHSSARQTCVDWRVFAPREVLCYIFITTGVDNASWPLLHWSNPVVAPHMIVLHQLIASVSPSWLERYLNSTYYPLPLWALTQSATDTGSPSIYHCACLPQYRLRIVTW